MKIYVSAYVVQGGNSSMYVSHYTLPDAVLINEELLSALRENVAKEKGTSINQVLILAVTKLDS